MKNIGGGCEVQALSLLELIISRDGALQIAKAFPERGA
jgi:hypothetical protein